MVKPMSLMSENMESYISSKFIVPEIRKSKVFFPNCLSCHSYQYSGMPQPL